MTRKKAIEDLQLALATGNYIFTRSRETLRMAISALENNGEWIPVSERLPKIADVYRVTRYYPNNVMNPNYLVDACAFDGSDTWYDDNRINHERAYVDNVIAWQENPEPYKAEKCSEGMSDTVKLIIEIPKPMYESVQNGTYCGTLYKELKNGMLLDDVKAEILQLDYDIDFVDYDYNDMPMTEEIHTICREEVMQILDNIGKAEGEGT